MEQYKVAPSRQEINTLLQYYYDNLNEMIKFIIKYNQSKSPIFWGALLSDMWTSGKNKRSMIDLHMAIWNDWKFAPEVHSLGICCILCTLCV